MEGGRIPKKLLIFQKFTRSPASQPARSASYAILKEKNFLLLPGGASGRQDFTINDVTDFKQKFVLWPLNRFGP